MYQEKVLFYDEIAAPLAGTSAITTGQIIMAAWRSPRGMPLVFICFYFTCTPACVDGVYSDLLMTI